MFTVAVVRHAESVAYLSSVRTTVRAWLSQLTAHERRQSPPSFHMSASHTFAHSVSKYW
jgi:hypothetical protein